MKLGGMRVVTKELEAFKLPAHQNGRDDAVAELFCYCRNSWIISQSGRR